MTVKFLICLFVILTALISCKNSNCGSFNNSSGITERDKWGTLLKNDTDDWTLKDHWSKGERALFDTTYQTNCVAPSNFTIVAYPNPTTGQFALSFKKTAATKIDFRLVDGDCNILNAKDNVSGNAMGIQPGNVQDGMLRLYYRFVEDGCQYEGHGDIMIKQ